MATLDILACQIDIPPTPSAAARDAHRDATLEKIRSVLSTRHHDLVVLPELSSIEYSRESFGNLGELAETLDGPSVQAFSELAREFNCAVVFGMPRKGDGHFHIAQVAIEKRHADADLRSIEILGRESQPVIKSRDTLLPSPGVPPTVPVER